MNIELCLEDGDALIIIPPFSSLDKPSLGAHILQACARRAGMKVQVLYANLIFARAIGERSYQMIANSTNPTFAGEYLFYQAAYGTEDAPTNGSETFSFNSSLDAAPVELQGTDVSNMKRIAIEWADRVGDAIARKNYRVVGCTSTFEQTSASVAVLKRVKYARPEVTTIMGGANCQDVMARGILSLTDAVDYVFSGEGETTFTTFLRDAVDGRYPEQPIVACETCGDLDSLPVVDYSEFYRQFAETIPIDEADRKNLWMPYETSRGCWYGQKRQCRFCGINGPTIRFREKSEDHVIAELRELLARHPNRNVSMSDCNMPQRYFRTLLPRLSGEFPGLQVFYELKANLSLPQMEALSRAGVVAIQPGIESLSTSCLRLMNKGVTLKQNLALLRYARVFDISVSWNILYGIPNDTIDTYQAMGDMLPALRHLQPPLGITPICIERFSPYFTYPEQFGITNVRPLESYSHVFPKTSDVLSLAYHFRADYRSESLEHTELMNGLGEQVKHWKNLWSYGAIPPLLAIAALNGNEYLLIDTRGLVGTQEINIITESQASLALAGDCPSSSRDIEWALEHKVIIESDSSFIPLCTAQPDLLRSMEKRD